MLVTRVERLETVGVSGDRVIPYSCAVEYSVSGTVDPGHGMVVNLADLKREIRERIVSPWHERPLDGREGRPHVTGAESLVRAIWTELDGRLLGAPLVRVRLAASPRLGVEWDGEEMRVTRTYEFSASHRLHVPSLSGDENVELFGKCNNPAGHGHNYVLEVTLAGKPGATGELLSAREFDAIVEREVSERWDHKSLHEDLPEFAEVNPTAEEIARVAWRRLAGPLDDAAKAASGARLHGIKLRETERNHVEYYGEDE